MARPPPSPYSQAGGWVGTGLCQAPLPPKRLSRLQRPFQGGSLPLATSTAGQPLPFPSLWRIPPCCESLVQRLSLPPGEHGHTKEALLHCPPTAPTRRASEPAPRSPPRPFSSHKYSSGYIPPAFGGGVSFPPPALVPAAKGLKRVLTVYCRGISLIRTHKSRAKITREKCLATKLPPKPPIAICRGKNNQKKVINSAPAIFPIHLQATVPWQLFPSFNTSYKRRRTGQNKTEECQICTVERLFPQLVMAAINQITPERAFSPQNLAL